MKETWVIMKGEDVKGVTICLYGKSYVNSAYL